MTSEAPGFVLEAARGRGTVAPGGYRVVVLEADSGLTVRDFDTLEHAERYADDAASECDGPAGSPFSYVFDETLQFIGRGMHYSLRSPPG